MSHTVTFVIHGTYAATTRWWRLGSPDDPTFADRLEQELSSRGMAGTVWRPSLDAGLEYASFAWSGLNRHRDRLRAGKKIAANVNDLAERVAATAEQPLTANFVAHSHGGNVVLEALPRLNSNVRVGRVALLGTPLITVTPAFRVARFVFATFLLSLFFMGLLLAVIQVVSAFVPDGAPVTQSRADNPWLTGYRLVLVFLASLIGYGWAFWLWGNFLDVFWRVLSRATEPIAWLRRRDSSIVYGPSSKRLAAILRNQPILSLTGHNDEADLLLQITCAPATLYRDYVRGRLSRTKRTLELLFVRPFVLGVFLKAVEMLLEVVSLGVPIWRALFLNFEVAPIGGHPYDRAGLLVRKRLDVPAARRRTSATSTSLAQAVAAIEDAAEEVRGVHVSLEEVTDEVRRQIRLRHSAYYENPLVIGAIANFVTSPRIDSPVIAPVTPSPLVWSQLWERLVVANVALAALFAVVVGDGAFRDDGAPRLAMGIMIGMAGYVIPFITWGIIRGAKQLVRRTKQSSSARTLWGVWSVFAILALFTAAQLRSRAPQSGAGSPPATLQTGSPAGPQRPR